MIKLCAMHTKGIEKDNKLLMNRGRERTKRMFGAFSLYAQLYKALPNAFDISL